MDSYGADRLNGCTRTLGLLALAAFICWAFWWLLANPTTQSVVRSRLADSEDMRAVASTDGS